MERAAALEPTYSEIRDHLGDAQAGCQAEVRKSWEQALGVRPVQGRAAFATAGFPPGHQALFGQR
jgi:hypothetical protein